MNSNEEPGIIKVGQMPGFECENRVYSSEGICPSIKIGGDPKKIIEIQKIVEEPIIVALDEQNKNFRFDSFGTLTTDGSSPKHNNRVVEIKQATKEGYIPCEVGGGMRSQLSRQYNTERKGPGERSDMSNANNGEYP